MLGPSAHDNKQGGERPFMSLAFNHYHCGGTGVAHSVECPTLKVSSGHGLRVVRSSPALGSIVNEESARDFLSVSAHPHLNIDQ